MNSSESLPPADRALETRPQRPPARPGAVLWACGMFFLIGGFWVVLGVVTWVQGASLSAGVLALLMFGNAAALAGVGVGLGRQKRGFFHLGLLLLALNIALTVTDEFGFWDLATLLFDLALVVLLIVSRAHYLGKRAV